MSIVTLIYTEGGNILNLLKCKFKINNQSLKINYFVNNYLNLLFTIKKSKLEYFELYDVQTLRFLSFDKNYDNRFTIFLEHIGFSNSYPGSKSYELGFCDDEFSIANECLSKGLKGDTKSAFMLLSKLTNFKTFSALKNYPSLVEYINLDKLTYYDNEILRKLHPQLKIYLPISEYDRLYLLKNNK